MRYRTAMIVCGISAAIAVAPAFAYAKPVMPPAVIDPILKNYYVPRALPMSTDPRAIILTPVKRKYMKGHKKPNLERKSQ